jgi:hypothetical protein
MSTWIDIIGSILIAGCVILTGLSLNQIVADQAYAASAHLDVQQSLEESITAMESDFRKIGYGTLDPTTAILVSQPHLIAFQADIDRDGTLDVIQWQFIQKNHGAGDTMGILTRSVNGGTPLPCASNVEMFTLRYLREDGTPADTTAKGQIWVVETTMAVKGPYKVVDQVQQSDRMDEARGFWRQTRLASRNIKRHG